ncbi:hypothetical protein REPUB_Repub02eG0016200 [Reevesia pubescens]
MSSSSNILLALCVVLVFYSTEAHKNQIFPALIAFGDSILDTGNNNWQLTRTKCNFPPYGKDFPRGKATGRWGNGRVLSDLVAEGLGIKSLVPPYLDPNLQSEELSTGVCFASGGSGVNPLTAKILNLISIMDQFNLFKQYLVKLERAVGTENAKATISNGLFLVSSGNNDIGITYFTILKNMKVDINEYTTKLVGYASNFVKQIRGLGARKFALLNTLPLGCLPMFRTLKGGVRRNCLKWMNEAAVMFNSKLEAEANNLKNSLPGAKIVFIDVFNPLLEVIQNPREYEFDDFTTGCCGTGTVEFAFMCNKFHPFTCPNANSRVFFDSVHPSERAYKVITPAVLKQILQHFST